MIYLQSYRVFESMQDGVTPEQRALLNASCQFYQKNNKMVRPEDAWWVDPATFNFIQQFVDIQNESVGVFSDLLNGLMLVDVTNRLDLLVFEGEYLG